MFAIILASQLWFVDYHAMIGTKKVATITTNGFPTKAECMAEKAAELPNMQKHGPPMTPKPTRWTATCTLRGFNQLTQQQLNMLHEAPNHHHEAP
jgi:hypothetical protein